MRKGIYGWRRIVLPPHDFVPASEDPIRTVCVPVIVKPPNHHFVLFDEIDFVVVKGIVPYIGDNVGCTPKRWLMRDHKVIAGRDGTLE